MKYLIPIIALSLCSCATRKAAQPAPSNVPVTTIPTRTMTTVRTAETVKAYPVGRYTDPNYPDEMHERHTVYRREQSPDWNYLPDPPYALPLGPTVAVSNPSPSYYVRTENEQMNQQQRAYAEALQEQNRAMKKRVEALQQEAGKVPELEQEINRLKKQLDDAPEPPATPQKQPAKTEEEDFFSSAEPELPEWEEGVSDPCEIVLFADSEDRSQAFLISQMRLHDEIAAELTAAERRKVASAFNAPFLRRKELALLTK